MTAVLSILGIALIFVAFFFLMKVKIIRYVILLSKFVIFLAVALLLNGQFPLLDNGFLSGVLWVAIVLTAGSFLCLLPRIDSAVMLICNFAISALAEFLVSELLDVLLDSVFNINGFANFLFLTDLGPYIFVFIALVIAVFALRSQSYMIAGKSISSKVVNMIDRVLAALIYGAVVDFSFVFLLTWEYHWALHILIVGGIGALMFWIDLKTFDRFMEYGRRKGSNLGISSYEKFNLNLFHAVKDALVPEKRVKK